MYKLQVYNALTQEIVRVKTYKKPDLILSLIDSAVKGDVCFLFDEDFRTYKGTYVNHFSFLEGDTKVFKIFFQLRLSEIQARVVSKTT